jgi:hypothetical protein
MAAKMKNAQARPVGGNALGIMTNPRLAGCIMESSEVVDKLRQQVEQPLKKNRFSKFEGI